MRAEFLIYDDENVYVPTGRRYYDGYDNSPVDLDELIFGVSNEL